LKKKLTTKIFAGIHKNKIIDLPSLDTTRSSKGILRESLFNTLQFEIHDSEFIEVFGGSGSIGLEALSRGASKVVFMEKNKNSFSTLKSNIKKLNEDSRAIALNGDSFNLINDALSYVNQAYIYIDPPFAIREGHEDIYDKCMELIKNLPSDKVSLIIIEHMTGLEIPDTIGQYKLIKNKKFGKSSLSYYSDSE
jgi:16S rRNA (guanine(966)-N(2))-methyltransferase RsmD